MPKMKTNSAASKRVRVTGSGKLMHAGSAMRHNLEHKSARKRRELKADGVLATSQSKNMKKLQKRFGGMGGGGGFPGLGGFKL